MARILILGGSGMAGHMARVYLMERGHEVIPVARSASSSWAKLDVEDTDSLLAFAIKVKPDWILNCVGALVKDSQENPVRAIRLNSLLPHLLAKAGDEHKFKLVHISTDCVFSGSNGPYRECAASDSNEIYGRTKSLGEIFNSPHLTIRTSIVGPELKGNGTGLFNWFMNQNGCVHGFGRTLWGGVTTLELAKAIDHIIAHPTSGLLHLTNGVPISKYDLLGLFSEIWGKGNVILKRDDTKASDRSLTCTRTGFSHTVPPYRRMLEELHTFMLDHPELYLHYN